MVRAVRPQQRAPDRTRRHRIRQHSRLLNNKTRTLSRRWIRPTGNCRPARAEREVGFFLSPFLSWPMVPLAPLPDRPCLCWLVGGSGSIGGVVLARRAGRAGEQGREGMHNTTSRLPPHNTAAPSTREPQRRSRGDAQGLQGRLEALSRVARRPHEPNAPWHPCPTWWPALLLRKEERGERLCRPVCLDSRRGEWSFVGEGSWKCASECGGALST